MVLPKRVDEAGLVERIDLRELRCADRATPWSGAQWDMLCAKYPYGRSLGIDQEAAIEKWLGTQLPFVRADWFVYAASRPPLYHDLLGLPGADGRPGADRALELMLGVDVPTNIIEGKRIARAGIRNKQSGVSQHNRLIERHDLADGAYYWKSYDFENSVDKRNVVLRPFGPASLPGLPVDQRDFAFDHDGGEIIFSLPNGLQGYLLVTEDGTRIDDGPSKIVFDRDDSADVKGQITNGVSCIACHAAGINLKLDEIREGALNVVSRGLKDELQALYPDGKEMNQLQEADKERFMAAVAGLGITAKCDQTQCEVVRGVSLRFAENLTYERAAAEFGLAPVEFGDALGGRLKGLRQQLKAGAVSREEFINRFKDIIEDNPDLGELSRCGAALAPPSRGGLQGRNPSGVKVPDWATLIEAAPDPAVVWDADLRAAITATGLAWRVKDTGTQIEMLLIPPGSFQMGRSESDQSGSLSDESPGHMVNLTNAFYLGRYEVTQAQWQARMGSNPSFFKSASAQVPAERVPNRPVEQVSWNQIAGSAGFMVQTGMRLPTEAEWEYAYRAGTTTAFHGVAGYLNGTNDDTFVGSIAWYTSNSNGQTRPVGGKAANGFGVHDMAGNVFEWVSDWYSNSYYKSSPSQNPPGPASGISRVFRGGSWSNGTDNLRASYRYLGTPDFAFNFVGCRAARSP
jgi:formylglycine-generating enzyme required for sulfatase activity